GVGQRRAGEELASPPEPVTAAAALGDEPGERRRDPAQRRRQPAIALREEAAAIARIAGKDLVAAVADEGRCDGSPSMAREIVDEERGRVAEGLAEAIHHLPCERSKARARRQLGMRAADRGGDLAGRLALVVGALGEGHGEAAQGRPALLAQLLAHQRRDNRTVDAAREAPAAWPIVHPWCG